MTDLDSRPTFVLVWPDGTVQIDGVDSAQQDGLTNYLLYHNLGVNDEPLANVYAVDVKAPATSASPLGMPLRQVKVIQTGYEVDRATDWIYVTYTLSWADHPDNSDPLATLTITVDGRA